MSGKLSVEEAKKLLTSRKGSVKRGWFGSKARNHVAFTLHCMEIKARKKRSR